MSIKFLLVISMLCKTEGHENLGHDHTECIYLIFFQILLTISKGNE